MQRRSFLALLVASPLFPALERLQALDDVPPAPAGPRLPAHFIEPPAEGAPRLQRYVLGFAPDEGFSLRVEPGRIARFVGCPQIPFRPRRLIIANGEAFELVHVAAAGADQGDVDGIPADVFSPHAIGVDVGFAVAHPGTDYVLAVRNVSKLTHAFHATLIGEGLSS